MTCTGMIRRGKCLQQARDQQLNGCKENICLHHRINNKQISKKLSSKVVRNQNNFKGTVQPDWICMRVVPLDRPFNKTSTSIGFLFSIFYLEYLIRVQSSESLYAKMNPTSCLFGSPRSFPPNRAPKMRERHQLFFGLRLVSKEFQHPAIQSKIVQHFGKFFHQIKLRQPIGRQDFYICQP